MVSLENQTTPFCSTGCNASPAPEGRVWPLWQSLCDTKECIVHIAACSVVTSVYRQCWILLQTGTAYVNHTLLQVHSNFLINTLANLVSCRSNSCHKNYARVARPSLLCAGDAVHPALQKGVVWFWRRDRWSVFIIDKRALNLAHFLYF